MRKSLLISVLSILLLSACQRVPFDVYSKQPIHNSLLPFPEKAVPVFLADPDPIQQILTSMTLDEKIGQMIIAGFYGTEINDYIVSLVNDARVGGIIFFGRNFVSLNQTTELLNDIKELDPKYPLFLSVDEEGGSVSRLPSEIDDLPSARWFRRNIGQDKAFDLGVVIGETLSTFGFNMNYAPVLDVDNGKSSSVMGSRSYSTDPQVVGEMGSMVSKGMEYAGVISVVKHFPGHGDVAVDSHEGVPVLRFSMERLTQNELKPFVIAIANDIPAIMVGHLAINVIDKKTPASLSYPILTGLLRQTMGYDGVIITDDLGMGAIRKDYSQSEAAVLAVLAGADVVMVSHYENDPFRVVEAIKEAILDGVITEARIDESVTRILRLKTRFSLDNALREQVDADQINQSIQNLIRKR